MRKLKNKEGCVALIALFVFPGLLAAWILDSWKWVFIGPIGMITLLLLIAGLAGVLSRGRKFTSQTLANALEQHLKGTEDPWDWDETTSVMIADEQLDALRRLLSPEFDGLETPEKRAQFQDLIDALRRGDIDGAIAIAAR